MITGKNVAPAGPTEVDLTSYCLTWVGVHFFFTMPDKRRIVYAVIPHASRCWADVEAAGYTPMSINARPALDYMCSVLAHELTECATSPHLDAWMDPENYENADKCSDEFGQTTTAVVKGNKVKWNVVLNGQRYLIQQNWGLVKQRCLSAP